MQDAASDSFTSRFLAQDELARLDIIAAMMLHLTVEARAELFDEPANLANARICNELLHDCLGCLTITPPAARSVLFAERMLKPLDDGDLEPQELRYMRAAARMAMRMTYPD